MFKQMKDFDYRESTISYCYETRTAELYFTRRSNYEKCLSRNPHYIVAEELNPGYRIVYPFNQIRTPEFPLRVPKGSKVLENSSYLTLGAA